MAASLGNPEGEQVISLLNASLLGTQPVNLDALIAEVQQAANAPKVKAAEAHWVQYGPATTATPPAETATGTTLRSRLEQATRQNSTAIYLAYITTIGFFGLVFCLIAADRWPAAVIVPQGIGTGTTGAAATAAGSQSSAYKDILMTLMGVIGTGWAGIISFYFGSSVGSRQQSETLQDISRGAAGTARGGAPSGGTPAKVGP
jgi:FtsH-binding integral membrane protein